MYPSTLSLIRGGIPAIKASLFLSDGRGMRVAIRKTWEVGSTASNAMQFSLLFHPLPLVPSLFANFLLMHLYYITFAVVQRRVTVKFSLYTACRVPVNALA